MIVDDHPLFRQGLRRAVETKPDLRVVAEADDGEVALRTAQEIQPQVMILDINLPSLNGIQVTQKIKRKMPHLGIILLTGYHDEEQALHAIRAGASAYFSKDVTPQRLVEAIHQVYAGKWVIGEQVLEGEGMTSWLMNRLERIALPGASEEEQFVPLSPREMEILQYTARGQSNKEIARTLRISEQTVKNHLSSILRKLPARDRTEATVYALRHGWIRLQDTRRAPETKPEK